MATESDKLNKDHEDSPIKINKKYPNPFIPLWLAILFFVIDYLAFQKPLSEFVSWLLIVIPLLLLATSFFFFARRKQFPWVSFPLDPVFINTISPEWNNVFHAVLTCLVFLFLAVMVTIMFLKQHARYPYHPSPPPHLLANAVAQRKTWTDRAAYNRR